MSSERNDSDLELVYHFRMDVWWGFCDQHFSMLPPAKGHYGYGDHSHPKVKCDLPWCKVKADFEVFPGKKFKASFWVPRKGKK